MCSVDRHGTLVRKAIARRRRRRVRRGRSGLAITIAGDAARLVGCLYSPVVELR